MNAKGIYVVNLEISNHNFLFRQKEIYTNKRTDYLRGASNIVECNQKFPKFKVMEVCQKYSNLIGQIDDLSNQQLWNS